MRIRSASLALVAFAAIGCSQGGNLSSKQGIPYPKPKVLSEGQLIAQVGDVSITTAEVEHRIRDESPFTRAQLAEDAQKKQFVDRVLRFELLAQEGWRRGLHKDPKILEQLKQLMVQSIMKTELTKIEEQIEVSDAELLKAYKEDLIEFKKPERVRMSQIVRYVDNDAERTEAKKLLTVIQEKVLAAETKNDPRAFSRFAKQKSQDEATSNGGGDLAFLSREELKERYGDAVTKFIFDEVKVGDMGIANAENAVVLFKKTGRRRGVERSLEQVRPQLRGRVLAKKRGQLFEDWVQAMMKKRGVSIDYSTLDNIRVDTGGTPSGLPAPMGN